MFMRHVFIEHKKNESNKIWETKYEIYPGYLIYVTPPLTSDSSFGV